MTTATIITLLFISFTKTTHSTNLTMNSNFKYEILNSKIAELRKSDINNPFDSVYAVCNDPKQLCQDGKCCAMKDKSGFGCCPYPDGTCCPKLGRCCASGYKCTSQKTINWIKNTFGHRISQQFHCIFDYSIFYHTFHILNPPKYS